ncbi:MAG TPA: hypothetical protein VK978_00860 [Candidatus Saccharimonadales bacterium]|nr:hypothetical protein [Candidatus Saccharimonadales bacterium]
MGMGRRVETGEAQELRLANRVAVDYSTGTGTAGLVRVAGHVSSWWWDARSMKWG